MMARSTAPNTTATQRGWERCDVTLREAGKLVGWASLSKCAADVLPIGIVEVRLNSSAARAKQLARLKIQICSEGLDACGGSVNGPTSARTVAGGDVSSPLVGSLVCSDWKALRFLASRPGTGLFFLFFGCFVYVLLGGVASLVSSPVTGEQQVPVDVVYTWVNGSDPAQIAALRAARHNYFGENQTDSQLAREVADASRYIDNEELRFSMRSLTAFAPWVRKVFLVTNGQVPHWLDTSHPKLVLVSHAQLFANSAHLPTFSSPAIETNLHRIPGLSPHFIYLNDDVMFGRAVWPSDFITQASGQRVFLAWACPNCNEGCPPNWIADGYCDLQCNVSACDYDGGDCINVTTPGFAHGGGRNNFAHHGAGAGAGAGWYQPHVSSQYCSRGCPSSWIGDKYCDRACKVEECGFDAGDCGLESMVETLFHASVDGDTDEIEVPPGTLAFFLNLTGLVGQEARITDGSHDRDNVIRTATISQKDKLMTMTLFSVNATRGRAEIHIEWEAEGAKRNRSFGVLVGGEKETTTMVTTEASSTTTTTAAATTASVSSRSLLSLRQPEEEEEEEEEQQRGEEKEDMTLPLHPMGVGERVGSSKYPWQQTSLQQRRLLDVYGDSLKHVNALYNKKFGAEARKVPAHMPHFVQLEVLQRLHASFPAEWEATSSHAFRASSDMQFAFAYFYFLINERQADVWPRLLNQLVDTDRDGAVSQNEFRTLWAMTHDTPLDENAMRHHYAVLTDNSTVPLTAARLETHPGEQELYKKLRSYLEKLPRNLHELHDTEEVGFVMVRNNDTSLKGRLDGIRKKRHKFICLNDNLKHESPDTAAVKQHIHDFYLSLLPLPCAFERQEAALRTDALFFWLLLIVGLVFMCGWLSYFARKIRKTD